MDRTRSRRAREPDAQAGRFACRSGQGGALLKPRLASAGAVAAGFLVTALASTAADAVMHAAGIFPSAPRLMSDPLFALASAYRALFTVAGGYVTARLAPDRPMRHAWILAGIGLVAGLAGVVAYHAIGGAELGPAVTAQSATGTCQGPT